MADNTPYHVKLIGSVNQFDDEAIARDFAERAERMVRTTTMVVVSQDEETGRWLVVQRLSYLTADGESSYALP